VAEKVGHGGWAGQEGGVGGKLLDGVGFAGAARPKLDEVDVDFAERDEAAEEEEFEPALHVAGLVTHAAEDQVHPFIRCEMAAALAVFLQLECRHLDRGKPLYVERVLPT
jgi:hypothetical protein